MLDRSKNLRTCGLCGAEAPWVCRQRLLGRHEADYFRCSRCDLLQTEPAYWLDEAYARPISALDTGAVRRSLISSRLTLAVATLLGVKTSQRCLDYGGGHGVFARMMRDLGFDFFWYDKHAENLFARGFEGETGERYALVTAFEVLEHLADVRADLERLFAPGHDSVLVATLLHEGHQPGWWYYMLESGQHICFYSRRTMDFIGERFEYDVLAGTTHTLFVRRAARLGAARRALLKQAIHHPWLAASLSAAAELVTSARSRIDRDHRALREAKP